MLLYYNKTFFVGGEIEIRKEYNKKHVKYQLFIEK